MFGGRCSPCTTADVTRPLLFAFPGQSSRDPAMFDRLERAAPGSGAAARARVEAHLGGMFRGTFATNAEIQVAVFEVMLAYLALARAAGLVPAMSAGLSLGEYAHLVAIGALDENEARSLVAARGACYDDGPDGVMVAIHPAPPEEIARLAGEVCDERDDETAVAVATINSPTQCVVAGDAQAVDTLVARADEQFFAAGTLIEQRVPMHTRRFAPVVPRFRPALARATWRPPASDYWPNVDAAPVAGADANTIVNCLARHVCEPVRWRETLDAAVARHPAPVIVEVGPLQVLRRLAGRRWLSDATWFSLDALDDASPDVLARTFDAIHDAVA